MLSLLIHLSVPKYIRDEAGAQDTPSLAAVKGNGAKNIPPLVSLPPATVSPCLGADKSYLSYSLHSVSDRRLVSSEKMKCKFY